MACMQELPTTHSPGSLSLLSLLPALSWLQNTLPHSARTAASNHRLSFSRTFCKSCLQKPCAQPGLAQMGPLIMWPRKQGKLIGLGWSHVSPRTGLRLAQPEG